MKKSILLFLALALPTLIVAFLQIFGKNEYEVKPLFQVETKGYNFPSECDTTYTYPYLLPSSLLDSLPVKTDLILISFEGKEHSAVKELISKSYSNEVEFRVFPMEPRIKRCVLLLTEKQNLVLIDRNRLIRGQYELIPYELGRLESELDIILKRYKNENKQ